MDLFIATFGTHDMTLCVSGHEKLPIAAGRRCRAVPIENSRSTRLSVWQCPGEGRRMDVSVMVNAGSALVLYCPPHSVVRRTSTGTVDCCFEHE